MRTVNTILGAVALILTSSAGVEAQNMVAGPITTTAYYDTLTCTAVNTSGGTLANIQIRIFDASGTPPPPTGITPICAAPNCIACPGLAANSTCSLGPVYPASLVGITSPFTCYIYTSPDPFAAIRGSLCATRNDGTPCLPADEFP
jgi:hypothetical protein